MTKTFENVPASELQKRLYGEPKKMYNHLIYCNADHTKPLGGDMCICLPALRRTVNGEYK
jgi:hypothetical protein